jgi:hypothetical protein
MKKKTRTVKIQLSEGELYYLDQYRDITKGIERGTVKLLYLGGGRYEMTRKEKLVEVWEAM